MSQEKDLEQLEQLSIFHYVVGGLSILFGLFPLFYVGAGALFLSDAVPVQDANAPFESDVFGVIFIVIGLVFFVLLQTMAWLIIYAGKMLKQRRRYKLIFIMACIQTTFFPFGTLLGVFTIIYLIKPSVKELFPKTF